MPNAFSPNGDGINDFFKPVSSELLSEFYLIVFNRWGDVVFESSDSEFGWDGYYKGYPLNHSVYGWKVVYTIYKNQEINRVKKTGTVVLVR